MGKTIFGLLLFSFLFISCLSTTNNSDCKRFKTGHFKLYSKFSNSISIIDRNDSLQTETDTKTGNTVRLKIKWTSDCEYELTYLSDTIKNKADTIVFFLKTKPIKTKIIKTGKDYCIFKATVDGINVALIDTLKVIK